MSAAQLIDLGRFDVVSGGLTYRQASLASLQQANVPGADILIGVKTFLSAQIDQTAETLRQKVLTPGVGQALEYQEATAEATAALASPAGATATLYPMLGASIGFDIDPSTGAPATDVLGVARALQATHTAWVTLGAAIRTARVGGKAAVAAATTVAAASAAYDAIVWPATGTPATPSA